VVVGALQYHETTQLAKRFRAVVDAATIENVCTGRSCTGAGSCAALARRQASVNTATKKILGIETV